MASTAAVRYGGRRNSDPFDFAKELLDKDIAKLGSALQEITEQLASAPCGCDLSSAHSLRRDITRVRDNIDTLAQTVIAVENDRVRFSLTEQEVNSRKEYVRLARLILARVSEALNVSQAQARQQCPQHASELARAQLFTNAAADGRRLTSVARPSSQQPGGPEKGTSQNSTEFIDNELMRQQEIERLQDRKLAEIAASATKLTQTAAAVNAELGGQAVLLTDFEGEVEGTLTDMNAVMKRMALVLQTNNRRQIKQIVYLLGIFIILLVLLLI